MDKEVTLTGEVDELVYYNEENGYAVFDFLTEDEEMITCTGCIYNIFLGEQLKLVGSFEVHKTYGKQLKVSSYERCDITSTYAITNYLSSGLFKGVGPSTAEKITRKFKKKTFEIIENSYEELASIIGISLEKAKSIHDQFMSLSAMKTYVMEMQNLGLSLNLAMKIYEHYKQDSVTFLKVNPYRYIDTIDGYTFQIADDVAEKLNFDKSSKERIEQGISYALRNACTFGNVFLPKKELIQNAKQVLGVYDEELISSTIVMMIEEKKLYHVEHESREDDIYLKKYFFAEKDISDKLRIMIGFDDSRNFQTKNSPQEKKKRDKYKKEVSKKQSEVNKILDELNLNLSDRQYEAVLASLINDVSIITGGPGTGKTTIINVICKYFSINHKKTILVAPTGRAAKRMAEATMQKAMTIHRLLEVQPATIENEYQEFAKNEDNPIEADVLIVDEMSMVDVLLFNSLLKAVEIGTKLILVGDEKQLPSVGPGNVLRDLIESKTIKTSLLTEVYRQADKSLIIKNAHKIRNNEMPEIKSDNDFFFVQTTSEKETANQILELVKERLPKYLKCKSEEIQVLSPMKKGELGTVKLNETLQGLLNPKVSKLKNCEVKVGMKTFRIGDKVMQIKNNYELEWAKEDVIQSMFKVTAEDLNDIRGKGIFNGDVGFIEKIDSDSDEVSIRYDEEKVAKYSLTDLNEVDLCYACTVHKSQGSEYKAVVIPVFNVPSLLANRNLIYTAITRAKELLVLVGRPEVFYGMVRNDFDEKRYSGLCMQLQLKIPEHKDIEQIENEIEKLEE